jgi:protein phosphatase 2C family protein 2/3
MFSTSQEVSDFVRKRIGAGMEPEEICEELMDKCLAPDCWIVAVSWCGAVS